MKNQSRKTRFELAADVPELLRNIDPLAPKHIEFDWELLRRLMHETATDLGSHDFEAMGEALRSFLQWICKDPGSAACHSKNGRLAFIGRRALALAWVINPDLFQGKSLNELARWMGIRNAKGIVRFRMATGEASRVLGMRNRSQKHGAMWKDN